MKIEEYRKLSKELRQFDYFRLAETYEYHLENLIGIVSDRTPAQVRIPNEEFNFWFDLVSMEEFGKYNVKIDGYVFRQRRVKETVRGHHGLLLISESEIEKIPIDLPSFTKGVSNPVPQIGLCKYKEWKFIKPILLKLKEKIEE